MNFRSEREHDERLIALISALDEIGRVDVIEGWLGNGQIRGRKCERYDSCCVRYAFRLYRYGRLFDRRSTYETAAKRGPSPRGTLPEIFR